MSNIFYPFASVLKVSEYAAVLQSTLSRKFFLGENIILEKGFGLSDECIELFIILWYTVFAFGDG